MTISLAEGQTVELNDGSAFLVKYDCDCFVIDYISYDINGKSTGYDDTKHDVKRIIEDPNAPPVQQGLSRRDQFAMAALTGIIAQEDISTHIAAELSAAYADHLIAELDKEGEE